MRKLIFSLIVFVVFSTIMSKPTETYALNFLPQWNNGYNHWLGCWNINYDDKYIRGNFSLGASNFKSYFDILNINPVNGWAMVVTYSGTPFNSVWNNSGNGQIGNWYINSDDRYLTLYKNTGKSSLLAINQRTQHSQLIDFAPYPYPAWNSYWGNNGNGWIGGWMLNDDDRYCSFCSDPTNSMQDFLSINTRTGWIAIQRYSYGNFTGLYSNGGVGSFAGWLMRGDDIYFTADLDNDGKSELIAVNAGSNCAAVFKLINGTMTSIWFNSCNSQIGLGGWTTFYNTKITTYDFDNDGKEEIMFVNYSNGWCTIKKFDQNSQYWPDLFTNYGSGWIDGWHIDMLDQYIQGNFYIPLSSSTRQQLFLNPSNGFASLTNYNNPTQPTVEDSKDNAGLQYEAYPNPFNMSTKINVNLKDNGILSIIIYDILGRRVKSLNNSTLTKGAYSFVWNGTDDNNRLLSSGTYFLRIIANNEITLKRLIIKK